MQKSNDAPIQYRFFARRQFKVCHPPPLQKNLVLPRTIG